MVEPNERGYVETEVDGTPFKIKDSMRGTNESSFARRLATRDDVDEVTVEYDGEVMAYFIGDERVWFKDLDGNFTIENLHLHPSEHVGFAAHVMFSLNS